MTNSYAAMALRGTIGCEIIDAYNKEDDITIAYQTQNVNLARQDKPIPTHESPKSVDEKSLF